MGSQLDLLGMIPQVGNHDDGCVGRNLFQGKMTILVAGDPFGGSFYHDGGKGNPLAIVTVRYFTRKEKISLDRLQRFSGLLLLLLNNLLVLKQLVQLLLIPCDVDEPVFPDKGHHVPGGGEHFQYACNGFFVVCHQGGVVFLQGGRVIDKPDVKVFAHFSQYFIQSADVIFWESEIFYRLCAGKRREQQVE